jgi:acyl-CoA reductase-like NAD-dependent aldehyde dehydrogenase
MTLPEKSRSEKPAPRAPREAAPRKLNAAERKRYLETMKREAERHRRTLAALAK